MVNGDTFIHLLTLLYWTRYGTCFNLNHHNIIVIEAGSQVENIKKYLNKYYEMLRLIPRKIYRSRCIPKHFKNKKVIIIIFLKSKMNFKIKFNHWRILYTRQGRPRLISRPLVKTHKDPVAEQGKSLSALNCQLLVCRLRLD